eukprot:2797418-Alexandrium_andersonii.AAC.1
MKNNTARVSRTRALCIRPFYAHVCSSTLRLRPSVMRPSELRYRATWTSPTEMRARPRALAAWMRHAPEFHGCLID